MADYRYTGSVPGVTNGLGAWQPGETKTVEDPALCAYLDASPLHEKVASAPAGAPFFTFIEAEAAVAAAKQAEAVAEAALADATQGNTSTEPAPPPAG